MKRYALVALTLLPACSAPDDALVQRCTTSMLSLFTECELSAKVLPQPRSAYIDGNTKNFKVRVSATFTVQKGHVSVVVPGCADGGRVEVAPGRTASLQCDATLNRSTFRFEVDARPGEGGAEGFAGVLSSRPI